MHSQTSDPDNIFLEDYDILKYKASIDFTAENEPNIISASCTINFKWRNDLNENQENIAFHLEDLDISAVYNPDGVELEYKLMNEEDSELRYYQVDYRSAESGTWIRIDYSGELMPEEYSDWGGVHNDSRGIYSIGVGFNNPYVSATRHWLPCYDHPSDKAIYELEFITPNDLSVASIGEMTNLEIGAESTKTTWATKIQTSTYLVSFLMDDFAITKDQFKKIPIEIYHKSEDQEAVDYAFQNLAEMTECFETVFDEPYNFEKIAYYIMQKPAAMEHQTLIAMSQSTLYRYFNDGDPTGNTISHELAHHWFGNLVSPKDFRDAWLNESFASFCEAIYLEYHHKDKAAFWQKMRADGESYLGGIFSSENAIPIYGYNRSESSNYPGTIYRKGSVVLGLLRHKLGDNIFFDVLKKYLNKYKFGNVSTSEALDFFEEESGQDLSKFYDEWIFGEGFPVLSYRFNTDGLDATVEFEQMQADVWQRFSELWIPISWENTSGEKFEIIYEFSGENDIARLGEDVDYSTVKVNESDSLYTLVRLIPASSVELNQSNVLSYDKKMGIISIDNETFNCPKVSMVDMLGREVFNQKVCSRKIETNSFEKGLYFFKLKEGKKEFFGKLIIE